MTSGPLAAGSVFAGDYRIVRALNAGGMGAVYVATQLSTGKERALKVMQPQLVASPEFRRRFEQEARVGAQIASEHVVEVQAAGVDAPSGMPFIVMELLRGADLAQQVEARGPVPPADVRAIFEQLAHAVGAAHTAGIVHRDLKPENIFLAESLRAGGGFVVKVLDFGIAKLAAEAGSRSTAAMGSPLWMSPEQTERAPITPAADVWAMGLIAFYMFTGKPFWRAAWAAEPTVTQLLREVCIAPISTASARAAEISAGHLLPPGFDEWFSRCVTRVPAERFPDAQRAWTAFAALGRAPSSPAFSSAAHDSIAFGATVNASSPAVSSTGPREGSTPAGVATQAPAEPAIAEPTPGRGRGGLVIAALAIVGMVVGSAATYALVHRRPPPVPVATGETPPPPIVVDTGTPGPLLPLSSLAASPPSPPLVPPPPATSVAAVSTPPVVPTVKDTDPSGLGAVPPARGACGCLVSDSACLMACIASTPASTASTASQGPPFDRAAAAASVNSIAVQSCYRPFGRTGQGRATLTYLPSGYVGSVTLDAPFAGTAVGGCVVSRYRKSVIPSFSGGPTTFVKTFKIQ